MSVPQAADHIPIWISNEWNPLQSAVVRRPLIRDDDPYDRILEEMAGAEIAALVRKALAQALPAFKDETDFLVDLLQTRGVQLHFAERQWDTQHEDIYIRDMLFAIRDHVYRGVAPEHRRCEWKAIDHLEPRWNCLTHLQHELDGGDED